MIDPFEYLKDLGLDDKEAKVYIAALSCGEFTVSQIAKLTILKRPTCYLILDSLVQKGLVSIIPNSKRLNYKAEKPEVLLRMFEQKLTLVRRVLPTLETLIDKSAQPATVKFYVGQEGIRNIYEDTLKCAKEGLIKEYYYFGSSKQLIEAAGKEYLDQYIHKRVKVGLKTISIRIKETEVHEDIYEPSKKFLRDVRYAPDGVIFSSTIFIYADKVAVVSTKKGAFGFVVESKEFYDTILSLFKVLWNISTPTSKKA